MVWGKTSDPEDHAARSRAASAAMGGAPLHGGSAGVPVSMNVLALDLGSQCGWALSESGRIESGVEAFEIARHESRGMRFVRFNRWLEKIAFRPYGDGVSTVSPYLIVYEQAHQRGGAATEVAAGFITRVHEFCATRELEFSSVHTATLKKWTTGRGNAKKPEMIAAVVRRWGAALDIDDNEADAVALLHYALQEIVPASAGSSRR